MTPEKRKLMVVGAAIAAAFALPGCAPAGYNATDPGAVQPVANNDNAAADANADNAADDNGDAAADDSTDDNAGDKSSDAKAKAPEGKITESLTGTSVKKMGEVVENADGFVFYRFDKDTAKPKSKSACNGDCAKVWPPALTEDSEPKLKGIDAKLVGTVTRDDGSKQLTIGGWPIYTYIGDKVAGTWKGQNVGGTWFVIKPDGTKNLTCLPKVSKPVAPPKDDSAADDSNSDDSSGAAGSDYSY